MNCMTDLASLNRRLAIDSDLQFVPGPAGLPIARFDTPACTGRLCLYGAHLLEWQPAGRQPVIFLSRRSPFRPPLPIRGGIPVCWPWFADHPSDPSLPFHGLVRTRFWQPVRSARQPDGSIVLGLAISDDPDSRSAWPWPFQLELTVTLGRHLDVELATTNPGDRPFQFTQALHTYFRVGDIRAVRVHGLDGADFIDKLAGMARRRQAGPVEPDGGLDRVYSHTGPCRIDDACWKRRIHLAKRGSRSTVIFNPGPQRARQMDDLDDQDHRAMLCVETANALAHQVRLEPGRTHRMGLTVNVEPMP